MKRFLAFVLVAILQTVAISAAIGQASGGGQTIQRHVMGRVLVQPRAGVSTAELDRILQPHGGRRAAALAPINVHLIALPPQANAAAVAAALRRHPQVKFAEVDGVVPPDFYPDDPQYANAWHLPKIEAPAAWDFAQGGAVTIAILDSGVDLTHPDLQPHLVSGWNFYDNNSDVTDLTGHGTAVAGVAAAASNNGVGVASVAFASKIMPMRITDAAGYGYFSMMASALITAADNGARVANISFLGVSLSDTVDSAAQYMRSKGGVVVVSGGNTGGLRTDPPRASLTVAASSDSADARAATSSWGDYIDVASPGVNIWTTARGGLYGPFSGTSAASPVVAGVYALMMSARPDLAPGLLDQILFSTTQDLGAAGYDAYFGHGRVNARRAVAMVLQASSGDGVPPAVAITAPTGGKISGLTPVDVAASDNVGVERVDLYANGTLIETDSIAPYRFSLDTTTYGDGQLALQAFAYDVAGNAATSAMVAVAIGNDTTAPSVAVLNPANGAVVSGSVAINVAANDDQRVARIELSIDGQQVALSYGASLNYVWNSNKGKGSKASSSIVARAYDAAGNAAMATISVSKR